LKKNLEFRRSPSSNPIEKTTLSPMKLHNFLFPIILLINPSIGLAQTKAASPDSGEYKTLFSAGMKLLDGRIYLDGQTLPAIGLLEKEELAKASSLLQGAARAEPGNGAPLLMLAKIEERLGNKEACVDWLQKANAVAPGNLIVVLELGGALGRQGRYWESAAVMAETARANPSDPRIHFNMGVSLLLAGDAPGAVKALKHVVKIEPALPMNQKVLDFAIAVASGVKPIPRNERELSANL
jgi:predicted Zn-dependent protease